jgi:CheY-like chemotaxis protein
VTAVADKTTAAAACEAGTFDICITDIALGDRTGIELMAEILEKCKLPAIAVTGFVMPSDIGEMKNAGFAAVESKPIDFGRLLATVERIPKQKSG